MSFDSEITVTSKVMADQVEGFVKLILAELANGRRAIDILHETDPDKAFHKGNAEYRTQPDQHLPAQMILVHNPAGGRLVDFYGEYGHQRDGNHLLIQLSTNPSTRVSEAVHALLIEKIGAVCSRLGWTWRWRFPARGDGWYVGRP